MGQNIVKLRADGIVEVTIVGKQNEQVIDEMSADFLTLVTKQSLGEPRVLADATRMIGSGAGTRLASQRALRNMPFSRLAVYGAGSSFVRHVIQMILDAFGDQRMSYLGSRSEALGWLSEAPETKDAEFQHAD